MSVYPDAIVVGAGLFGSTIARALMDAGMRVEVVDDARPLSGSRPSACLMKPSWFSGLGKDVHEPSLTLLDHLYGLQELVFEVWPIRKRQTVFRVDPLKVLDWGSLVWHRATAVEVGPSHVGLDNGDRLEARRIIVAAGYWCGQLLQGVHIQGKQGISYSARGTLERNIIKPWAPYKQSVSFQSDPGWIWVGDGTAIKPKNWTDEREEKTLNRCADLVGQARDDLLPARGIRPYVPKVKPCLLERRPDGIWLATGGAKNGMVAAGWAASEILRAEL